MGREVMTDMSAFSRPGIPTAPEEIVIREINKVFRLRDSIWVKDRFRGRDYPKYRQILIAVLIDNYGYNQTQAGAVCFRSRVNALASWKRVHNTLISDKEFGERVKRVYEECR
jgi:hypothetical protein